MSRAAYHRAYYWAHLESRREASRVKQRRVRWVRGVVRVLCQAVDEAQERQGP
jgi:hypothetical protein